MRRRAVVLVSMAAVAVSGCTSPPVSESPSVPVVVAEPVPLEGTGLAPTRPDPTPAVADASVEQSPEPTSTPSEDPAGPSSGDAAAFVSGDALAGIAGIEHVVVDLDGDAWPEVVAAGIEDRIGVVRVAWWTAAGYEVLASGTAGPGRGVTDLRAADVNEDGLTELAVAVEGEGLRSLALWAVPRRGQLDPLEAVGGCHGGSHVYGVTVARLAAQTEGPAVIVADCDESPLPVADWSEHRWTWRDGAYRHEEPARPGRPDDPGGGSGGEPGDGSSDDGNDGNQGRGND